jgi:hypothetical protein
MFYLRTQVDSDGTTVYRPFHQGLADYLRTHPYHRAPDRDPNPPHSVPAAGLVLDTLLTPGTQADRIVWANASPYLLRHAIEHAVDAKNTDKLITDPEFLVHADPYALTAALSTATSQPAALIAAVYRTSLHDHRHAHPETRRFRLAIDAARHRATHLQHQLTGPLPAGAWRPRWATGRALTGLYNTLTGHTDGVSQVACTTLDDRTVAVTSAGDGTVRVWDLRSGQQIGLFTKSGGLSGLMACTTLGNRTVLVTGNFDGVRVWDLRTGQQIGQSFTSPDEDLRVWDLRTSQQIGRSFTSPDEDLCAMACTTLDDRTVVVTGESYGTVCVWDLRTGQQIGKFFTSPVGALRDVACTTLGNRTVVVTGDNGGWVRVWDLRTGQQALRPLAGDGHVNVVACTTLDGRNVVVTGGLGGTLRVRDLHTGEEVGEPLTGHYGGDHAVACTTLDTRTVAVTGDDAGTVRV